MVARECFRKGGRRIIENPYRTDDGEKTLAIIRGRSSLPLLTP